VKYYVKGLALLGWVRRSIFLRNEGGSLLRSSENALRWGCHIQFLTEMVFQ
jgi:hypothetical protein